MTAASHPPRRRLLGIATLVVVVLVGTAIGLELLFRVAALFVDETPETVASDATVILCVGDSHTRGRADPGNYPYALQQLLDAHARRRYRVVNVGVPGMNTAQVRARLARYLAYYRPAIVLHWAGINNFWNAAGQETGERGFMSRLVEHSRLARFVQVALFYRALDQATNASAPVPTRWDGKFARFHVDFAGEAEEIRPVPGADREGAELRAVTRADLEAMAEMARAHGARFYALTYPLYGGHFAPVNQAVREFSKAAGVPAIETMAATDPAQAEVPGQSLFDDWVHPLPVLYRHIAAHVYATLVAEGAVDAPPFPGGPTVPASAAGGASTSRPPAAPPAPPNR